MLRSLPLLCALVSSADAGPGLGELWRAKGTCDSFTQRAAAAVYAIDGTTLRTYDLATGREQPTVALDPSKVNHLEGVVGDVVVMLVGGSTLGLVASTGKERWSHPYERVAVVGDAVYGAGRRGQGRVVERANGRDGAIAWSTPSHTTADAIWVAADARHAAVLTGAGELAMFDAASGALAWQQRLAYDVDGVPTLAGDVLAVVASDARTKKSTIHILDAAKGTERAAFARGALSSDAFVVGGRLVFSEEDRAVYAVDLATRKVAWRTPLGEEAIVVAASPDAGIAVADRDHGFTVLDPRTGKIQGSYAVVGGLDARAGAGAPAWILCDGEDVVALDASAAGHDSVAHVTGTIDNCSTGGCEFRLGPLHRKTDAHGAFAGTVSGRGRFELRFRDAGGWVPTGRFVELADPATHAMGRVAVKLYR